MIGAGLFARGNYLLGTLAGVMFAAIALAIALIGYGNLVSKPPSAIGIALSSLFATACAAIMVTPTTFSPSLQHFIDKQAADRNARKELATLIRANSDYRDVKIETEQLKVVFVSITGTVPNRVAIDRLLADLSRLDFARHCSLRGRVTLRDTGEIHEFDDDDLSRNPDMTTESSAYLSGTSESAGEQNINLP